MTSSVPATAAQSLQTHIIKEFLDHGSQKLAEGNIKEAINDYANVLLLDHENQQAQDALLKLAESLKDNPQFILQLKLFQDLLAYQNNLKKRVDYYKRLRNDLGQELISVYRMKQNDLTEEMKAIQEEVVAGYPPFRATNKFQVKQIDPLLAVNETLEDEKRKLTVVLAFIKAQYERLNQIEAVAKRNIQADPLKDEIVEVAGIRSNLKKPNAYEDINTKIMTLEDKVKMLSDQVTGKDTQLERLSNEVVNLSLELSEKDATVSNKSDTVTTLSQEMMEIESRLSLSEKIIQEKDAEIKSLRQTIALNDSALRAQIQDVGATNFDKLIEVTGILEIYKAKLTEAVSVIKANSRQMAQMNQQLLTAQTKLFERDIFLEKISQQLDAVNGRIVSIQTDLTDNVSSLKTAEVLDNDLAQLQGQLKSIQSYLAKKIDSLSIPRSADTDEN